jgi:hypothetical protein
MGGILSTRITNDYTVQQALQALVAVYLIYITTRYIYNKFRYNSVLNKGLRRKALRDGKQF